MSEETTVFAPAKEDWTWRPDRHLMGDANSRNQEFDGYFEVATADALQTTEYEPYGDATDDATDEELDDNYAFWAKEVAVAFDSYQGDVSNDRDSDCPFENPAFRQVGGTHYQIPIQPIEYIMANDLNYCEGQVVKYVSRWQKKGGIEDLEKAKQYLEFMIYDASNNREKYGS